MKTVMKFHRFGIGYFVSPDTPGLAAGFQIRGRGKGTENMQHSVSWNARMRRYSHETRADYTVNLFVQRRLGMASLLSERQLLRKILYHRFCYY
jgi:hypothetical protein